MNFTGSHVNVTVSKIVPTGPTNQIVMEALERHQPPLDEQRLPGALRQQDAPPPDVQLLLDGQPPQDVQLHQNVPLDQLLKHQQLKQSLPLPVY